MQKIPDRRWPWLSLAVATVLMGASLLMGYQRMADAADADAMTSGGAQPQHDHPLPKITMWEKNADKPCSFSLYDGQKINFKDSSSCPNDEHYFFSIQGAHEGMWLEIQNNPDCGNNESYAFYKVSFQDQQIGDIGVTEVQLSQGKTEGTRLIDGNGKPYLLADGWRGSSNLQGAVSCVKVGQLLPDGPFRYRSKTIPDKCVINQSLTNFTTVHLGNCDHPTAAFFSTLSSGTPLIYAAWIARTKTFAPALGLDMDYSVVVRVRVTPDRQVRPLEFGSDGRLRHQNHCVYAVAPITLYTRDCSGADDEVFIRERVSLRDTQ
ncbi:hypothetical protein [Pandoraea sputorum]|uniref:Uncharacterized protein n=1 Tax=Pandoraea sputorum TaxID=93222 RepID=A0A239SL21_9BURK|nr:hypothetical protein [Pandoraea sputorum]SNU85922.1 Uncharacterised protein [Pandoraea sputorum]VVE01119.1 hypothetical protein PSP20601_02138 [Pandoraea sputorum]